MAISITSQDQKQVDHLRISLAQAMVDLTQVFVHDPNSEKAKTDVIKSLSHVRRQLDKLGIVHACAIRFNNVPS